VTVDSATRIEMLGATLDLLDEGVALLDVNSLVVYWNDAAAALTGHRRMDLLSRTCPADLYQIAEAHGTRTVPGTASPSREGYDGPRYSGQLYIQKHLVNGRPEGDTEDEPAKPLLVQMKHHLGHSFPVMLRKLPIRDTFGKRLGTVLIFRPAEELDEIPHGETGDAAILLRSQGETEERLDTAFHEWKSSGAQFGLLWITVDQAAQMRRSHGRDACEAMLKIVEHRLGQALRPSEIIGRWGNDEFLVLSHERTLDMLMEHAHHLAGMTRTADFRWWGDRISLTASIGAAQAATGDSLPRLMLQAQQSMHASVYAGGNHVTHANSHSVSAKGEPCSR
jgi:diguanylate cyclase (GGDEF)-like protein